MSSQIVANEIVQQLGGFGKISAMVNARNFSYTDNSLNFRFSGSKKSNMIKITLNSMDTYDIEFIKFSPKYCTCKVAQTHEGIYNDQLIDLFVQQTGLYLSL